MILIIDHPDPRDHLHTEWLLTNGLGGYAMGTVLGINTRRYHGLLVASMKPPVERVVALHSMIEQLVIPREDGTEDVIDLSTQMFVGRDGEPMLHPEGWTRLARFELAWTSATWTYQIGEGRLSRVLLWHPDQTVAVNYIASGLPPCRLRLRSLVALRDFHQLTTTRRDFGVRHSDGVVRIEREGASLSIHSGVPEQFVAPAWRDDACWWDRFAYVSERDRGQDWVEDAFSPGYFEAALPAQPRHQPPPAVSLGFRIGSVDARRPPGGSRSHPHRRQFARQDERQATARHLLLAAADDFVVQRVDDGTAHTSIIAGYPWFADWGRDAMIALPGLLLSTGRLDDARDVLLTFARHMKHGLIPNRFDDADGEPHYNTVDASLWFVHAVWSWWCAVNESPIGGAGDPPAVAQASPPAVAQASPPAVAQASPPVGGAGVPACDRSPRLNGGEGDATPPASHDIGSTFLPSTRQGVTERLTVRRRRLPHWEAGGHAYFITFKLRHGSLNPEERQLVAEALLHWHGSRLRLYVAVVMPDHVHMLIQPLEKEPGIWWSLSELLHSIKGFTSHRIQRSRGGSGALWQAESYDRIVRDEDEFWEKWWYIESNPMRAGLVDRPEAYPYTIRGVGTADEAIEASSAVAGGTPAPPKGGTPAPPKAEAHTPSQAGTPTPPSRGCNAELLTACRAIIHAYRAGIRFDDPREGHHGTRVNIGVTRDGLVSAGDETTQLTWMDAARDGVVFTPRHGLAVEVNALWHHAIRCLADMVESEREREDLIEYAGQVALAFQMHFWWGEKECLHDVLSLRPPRPASPEYVPDGSFRFPRAGEAASHQPTAVSPEPTAELVWTPDGKLRPNQIFAVSLPYSPLTREQQRLVVECVRRRFLTPFGLRTLDRADPNYHPRYEGSLFERDAAYHNGTVWPWLIGPYGEAVLRVNDFSEKARREVRALLQPLLDETTRTKGATCLGQIAEVYDGDEPHRPSGCPAQAWSVAEVLRLRRMVE